jgi:uncharacterized membrane protein YgdD (TMEM256/DUF423 family)
VTALARLFLVVAAVFGFVAVAVGAFGAHALRSRLRHERLSQLDTGVRYQLWHALALFAVVLIDRGVARAPVGRWTAYAPLMVRNDNVPAAVAGWLFIAGIVLFSGSLYALALTGERAWARITPIGGLCFLLGWLALGLAVVTA